MDKKEAIKDAFKRWSSCTRCPLAANRDNVVFGMGNINADIMIIGEAPGKQENETGLPFVGPSGELLNSTLEQAGLSRQQVYITNVVACIPLMTTDKGYKSVRPPSKEEMEACYDRLVEEIYIVDPKVIVLLGGTAVKLIRSNMTISTAIRSQPFMLKIPGKYVELSYLALASWHPAYIIRKGGASSRERAGSELEELRSCLRLAANIVRAAKRLAA